MSVAFFSFALSLLLVAYTFFGYPLLLLLWARFAPRQRVCGSYAPRVAIIIVVYNGELFIREKIECCLRQDYPKGNLRVLVVSDGSNDDTCDLVRSYASEFVTLQVMERRRGKAACLNDAVYACDEEILIFTDVRQILHPQAVSRLVDNFFDASIGAVSGQLVFEREGMTEFGESIDAYWRYEKILRQMESAIHSSVGVTGAIYALRRNYFCQIPTDTILDDVLIPMNVVLNGKRVLFEKEATALDRPSRFAAQERIRKVRTLAGNFQIIQRHPEFLMPWRNPIALQFISHKLMRLIVPVALVDALISNLFLLGDGYFYVWVLIAQIAAYGMALCGFFWKRIAQFLPVKLAMGFLSLNWFVVLGFVEFLSNRDAHLWKSDRAFPSDSGPST